jgi:hypothetical protein
MFNVLDLYVHERLGNLASVKQGLWGRNWTTRLTYGCLTTFRIYRLTGTLRHWGAHA